MASPHSAPNARQIRLQRRHVLAFATVLTFIAGTLFSGAAAAAGISSPDLLALIFALGGCATLFLLLVWYISNLTPVHSEAAAACGKVPGETFDQGTAWKQSRRPPSGSTIMWAANVLRRRTDAASLR